MHAKTRLIIRSLTVRENLDLETELSFSVNVVDSWALHLLSTSILDEIYQCHKRTAAMSCTFSQINQLWIAQVSSYIA